MLWNQDENKYLLLGTHCLVEESTISEVVPQAPEDVNSEAISAVATTLTRSAEGEFPMYVDWRGAAQI